MVVLLNQLSFFQFVKPSHLFDAALFFSLLALIFLILTFFVLYKKKHTYRTEQFVEKRFELLISKAILNDDDDIEDFIIPANIERHTKNIIKRQYAIDVLVKAKRSMRGKAG